jgi:hypothetical protein
MGRPLTRAVSSEDRGFVRVDGCDLCRAAKITPWFHEDEICWIGGRRLTFA